MKRKKAAKKVLLVDDDADFVAMNKAVLEKRGYQVETAYNGEECVAKAVSTKPDLIVLDVMMATPTDGFHVTYNLRNADETRNIPILMVTSVNQQVGYKFDKDDTWLPVDSFIEKPISPEKLIEVVSGKLGP